MDSKIEKLLYNLAKKSFLKNEVPISSLILNEKGKIIAKSYNKRHRNNNILGHSEILALKKAARKMCNWKLQNLTLITTFEPCMMCTGAIIQSGIKNIIFMHNEPKFGFMNSNHTFDLSKLNVQRIKPTEEKMNHLELIKEFFIKLRVKNTTQKKWGIN